jgi:Aspartyl protease
VRFDFLELPGEANAALARPVVQVQVEDLEEAPQLCLVDTGSTANRFGAWLAEATGVDLSGAPETTVHVGGVTTVARHARADLTIAGVRYDAPVSFCDPWPLAFNLLGQEGFLRFFRVTLCAAEGWLDLEPESATNG